MKHAAVGVTRSGPSTAAVVLSAGGIQLATTIHVTATATVIIAAARSTPVLLGTESRATAFYKDDRADR
ncbi:MAG: hypothetical protein KDA61_19365, partial [Planctomycetales bacterium]|nr:hypothetical protein [Planctomycetales bacterium]